MKKKLPDYDELRPHYDFDYDKMKPNRFAGEKKVYKHTTVILRGCEGIRSVGLVFRFEGLRRPPTLVDGVREPESEAWDVVGWRFSLLASPPGLGFAC